jgi:30S ribosomal protein S31
MNNKAGQAQISSFKFQVSNQLISLSSLTNIQIRIMGKGDKKTKKGKTFKNSFGKSRPKGRVPAYKPVEKKEEVAK